MILYLTICCCFPFLMIYCLFEPSDLGSDGPCVLSLFWSFDPVVVMISYCDWIWTSWFIRWSRFIQPEPIFPLLFFSTVLLFLLLLLLSAPLLLKIIFSKKLTKILWFVFFVIYCFIVFILYLYCCIFILYHLMHILILVIYLNCHYFLVCI